MWGAGGFSSILCLSTLVAILSSGGVFPGKGGREGCDEVTAKEEFILRKGADGAACEGGMSELGSESVIPIPFAGDCMERVNVSGNHLATLK